VTPFWWRWPSWLVEGLAGLGLITLTVHVFPGWVFPAVVATILSVWYEAFLDVHGWSWRDIGQRTVGVVGGLILWRLA